MRRCFVAALGLLVLEDIHAQGVSSLRDVRSVRAHTAAVRALAYSPDGAALATCSDDGSLKLWDATGLTAIHAFRGAGDAIRCLSFSPDGRLLASGSKDKTVTLWEVKSGKRIRTFEAHSGAVAGVAFHPSRPILASAGRDHTIKLWDLDTHKVVRTLRAQSVNCFVFSPDGKRIVAGSGKGAVEFWESGSVIRTFKSGALHVYGVAHSRDGKFIAIAGKGGGIGIHDAKTGKSVVSRRAGKTGMSVAFRPDGRRVATGLYEKIYLVDLPLKQEIEASMKHPSWIFCLTYSPDSRHLVSGDGKGNLRLFRTDKE
ncbi:MAG: WD40 repeat domain-containing protein [Planctomycetota bacterium]|nr:WD40 repeat domain-containing protein [Planctomycetota bacterium]